MVEFPWIKNEKIFICPVTTTGWWRSWLSRRSHSCLSYPEVESSSLSHPKINLAGAVMKRSVTHGSSRHVILPDDSSTSELSVYFFSPASQLTDKLVR